MKRQASRFIASAQKQEGGTRPMLERDEGTRITVRVTPRARRNELIRDGATLRARLTAPPVDGAANEALIELLAARLNVPRRAISIVRGAASRMKTVAIAGVPAKEIWERIGSADDSTH